MQYRQIKKTNIRPSLLGFGCMRFPLLENGKIDEVQTEKMLDLAIKNGVNYIDTAYPYLNGESEPLVGKLLKKYDRSKFYLATKLPFQGFKSVEDAKRIFNDQLKRLQTEYIDFYLLHALNNDRFNECVNNGIIKFCLNLKKEGKIKHLGFSFHDSYSVFEKIINHHDWDFCQLQLNYMDKEEQAGIKGYNLAKEKNISVVVMEPLKGGSLTKFAPEIEKMFYQRSPHLSLASWALRYVASLDNVSVILSGMSTYEQVVDNLQTMTNYIPLSEDDQNFLLDVEQKIKARVKNNCTNCQYCLPCPQGVNIPRNFLLWNKQAMYDNYDIIRFSYSFMSESEKAYNCIACGKCEKLCPQHISIIKDLQNAAKTLGVLDKENKG